MFSYGRSIACSSSFPPVEASHLLVLLGVEQVLLKVNTPHEAAVKLLRFSFSSLSSWAGVTGVASVPDPCPVAGSCGGAGCGLRSKVTVQLWQQ